MLLTDHPRSGLRRPHRRESSLPPPQAVKPASATTRHTRLIARHEPVRPRSPEPARLEHKSRSGLHRSLRPSRPKTTRTEAAHSRGSTHSRHPCHRDAERARRYRRRGTRPYWPITCGVNRKPPARCFATQSANDKCSSAPNEPHRITGPASSEKPSGRTQRPSISACPGGLCAAETATVQQASSTIHGGLRRARRAKLVSNGRPLFDGLVVRSGLHATGEGDTGGALPRCSRPEGRSSVLTPKEALRSPFPHGDHLFLATSTLRSRGAFRVAQRPSSRARGADDPLPGSA